MNLSFDNLDELKQFLNWAYEFRGASAQTSLAYPRLDGVSGSAGDVAFDTPQGGVSGSVGGHSVFTAGDGSPADQEAKDLKVGPYDPSLIPPMGDTKPADSPEPAKRKRRTKAEIEADETAAAAAAGANLKDAAASDDKAAEGTQAPTGTNPFDKPAESGTAVTEPLPDAAEDAAETVVTPFQHLTRAREFIAKHGMPKYNESFTKAGLDANVMGYSAFQRALHMTALDELDKG